MSSPTDSTLSTSASIAIAGPVEPKTDCDINQGDAQVDPDEKPKHVEERVSFPPGDGNVTLQINGSQLETHKHILRNFKQLDLMLSNEPVHGPLKLELEERGIVDFQNTFKILYATVFQGPFEFDSQILTSALRISTAYDCPTLRNFAIKGLEKACLGAVERIRLARLFQIPNWEASAFNELVQRDACITLKEAYVLEMETCIQLAAVREKESQRKSNLAGAASVHLASGQAQDVPHLCNNKLPNVNLQGTPEPAPSHQSTPPSQPPANQPAPSSSHSPSSPQLAEKHEQCSQDTSNSPYMKPCFINTTLPNKFTRPLAADRLAIRLPVLDCTCQGGNENNNSVWPAPCTLPPCAVSAFKELQIQQVAHTKEIAELKEAVCPVKSAPTGPITSPRLNNKYARGLRALEKSGYVFSG